MNVSRAVRASAKGQSYVIVEQPDPGGMWPDALTVICTANNLTTWKVGTEPVDLAQADSANPRKVWLKSPLGAAHTATDTLCRAYAGLSNGGAKFCVVTASAGGSGRLGVILAHELLHWDAIGGSLHDLSEPDNLMFWTMDQQTHTRLRWRPVKIKFGNGPCGSDNPGTEQQWNKIPRP